MITVDASVAAKWVLNEAHEEKAAALYEDAVRAREPLVAPPLLPVEVTNILWQRVRRQLLTRAQATEALTRFLAFRVTLVVPPSIHREALSLAATYTLPAAYDAYYLALAAMLGATLWTDDQRLLRLLSGSAPFVRSIANYPDSPPR